MLRILATVLLITTFSQWLFAETISPDDARIRYTGRWNHSTLHSPWIAWQGSSIAVQVSGGNISIELENHGSADQFRVIIDEEPNDQVLHVKPGRHRYVLAAGLPSDMPHKIELFKETFYGKRTTFHNLQISEGQLLNPPPRPNFRIAFFGDSNMDGTSLYSEKNSGDMGSYYGFPATTSRMLGAEMHLQAYGGARLAGPGHNTVTAFIYSQDWHHQIPGYRSGFAPQVIVVNAGANDIGQVRGPNQVDIIKDRYRAVIKVLRDVYGDSPHIVLMNAYGWDLQEPANYSREVISGLDSKVSVLLYPWIWELWHGSMIEHAGQSRLLAEHIINLNLGFGKIQDAEVFDSFGRNFDVTNGSFENAAVAGFSAFGWRYHEDGVERIHAPDDAADGAYFIRLQPGEQVHQGTDATGDFEPGPTKGKQKYTLSLMIRSNSPGAKAEIGADFEEQSLYQRKNAQSHILVANHQWREHSVVLTAPEGSWKTYVTLKSLSGDIDIDAVKMAPLTE
ncbi:MAG: GDSL-type esterase/lipase family protein [Pseudomonadales bacterium]